MQLCFQFDFVRYAYVSSSAARRAIMDKLPEATLDSLKWRHLAIRSLNTALNQPITEANADAALAASIVLSNQLPDW
jgi:hypothetical protein